MKSEKAVDGKRKRKRKKKSTKKENARPTESAAKTAE